MIPRLKEIYSKEIQPSLKDSFISDGSEIHDEIY